MSYELEEITMEDLTIPSTSDSLPVSDSNQSDASSIDTSNDAAIAKEMQDVFDAELIEDQRGVPYWARFSHYKNVDEAVRDINENGFLSNSIPGWYVHDIILLKIGLQL